MNKIKIILIGTSELARYIFKKTYLKLLSENFQIINVITTPDKFAGRKKSLSSPVKQWALRSNLSVLQPQIIRDSRWIQKIKKLNPDLIILTDYGQIIPKQILNIPKHGAINIHPSLLPKYRGASPIQAAILNNDHQTGTTIILMDEKLDHGPILASSKLQITNSPNYEELSQQLAGLGAKLLVKTLPKWVAGKIQVRPQNHSRVTFTKIINKEDGKIDWNNSAKKIERKIRAYHKWPNAYTFWNNKSLTMFKAKDYQKNTHKKPGEVFLENKDLAVQTGKGVLILKQVQLQGKKQMAAKDFLNGHQKIVGATLR